MQTSRNLMLISRNLMLALLLLATISSAALAQFAGTPFPATAETSDQKTGSVLVYPLYKSDTGASENTEISLTNTHLTSPVAIHFFYVDENGSSADTFAFLAPKATLSMLASDFDPGNRGYVIAIAVDSLTGCPISFNHLLGSETIKLATGHSASLGAQAFTALFTGTSTACSSGASTAALNFDGNPFSGSSYNRVPQTLALNHISSLGEGNSTVLVVSRIGGNLASGVPAIGSLAGVIYDLVENSYGFTFSGGTQFVGTLSNNFPRTTPRLPNIIPTGSFGWMKFAPTSNIGLIGATLNFNSSAGANSSAFNEGANLAALTFANNVTLTMPVFSPGAAGSFSTTTISATPNPSVVGQSVTFTATVTPASPSAGTPAGDVQFYDGFSLIGTGTLSGNTATVTTSALTLGTHLITAVYLGDATFARSTSSGLTQTVNLAGPKAASTTALVSSVNPSSEGQAVSFTATVSGSGTPTGTVEFFDGSTSLGNIALNGNSAVMSLSNFSATTHAITAVYSGDFAFNGSTSSTVSQQVNAAPPPPGFAASEFSDQKTGSVLFFNLYSSNAATPQTENTDLSLTNTNNSLLVTVHLFFVRNTGQVGADRFVALVPNQTVSLLASEADPGATGYVIAVAIDPTTGAPISFNHLTGEASVKLASGHFASLPAQAFAALYNGTLPGLAGGATAATLNFDGTVYNRAARSLQIDHLASRSDGNSAMLIVNRLGGSIVAGGGGVSIGPLSGILYNALTNPASFTFTGGNQFKGIFGQNNFPQISPNYNSFVPIGSYAWMKFNTTADVGILGAVINYNPNVGSIQNAFNYGHNLQAATLTSATLEIPVTPPANLSITKTHTGDFTLGSNGTYTITVSNASGAGQVSAPITVTDTLPGNLTLSGFSGTGWNCTGTANVVCTNSDGLAGGSSLMPLVLTVAVGSGTPLGTGSITNTATVATTPGQEIDLDNNSASDPTTVSKATTTTTVNSSSPTSIYGQSVTFTATVTSSSTGTPTGTVEFFDGATSLGTQTLSSGSATLTPGTLTAISHSITAVYSGDASFTGSTSAIFTQTVNKASLTVTADNKTKVYGAANPAFTATITGFVNSETASVVSGAAALSTTATAASSVNSYPITVAVGTLSATNYTFTLVNGTLRVTKATLTVTADNKTKIYGAANPAFTATITGFVNGDTSSVITGAAGLSTTATAASPVASYPITAVTGTLSATNYIFTFVNGTLSITQATLTVTADNKTKVYGAANPALTATITGFVNGDTASAVSGAAALSTTATASSGVGSYAITAAVGTLTATNYTFTFVNGSLTVTAATLTVMADNKTKVYGSANPALTASFSGFVNGDPASVVSGAPGLSTTATTSSSVNSYPITITVGTLSATNYTFTFVNSSLTVTKATLTVTASNATRSYGATNPSFSGTVSGIQNSDNITATFATTATPGSPVGPYPITPTLNDPASRLSNYTVTSNNGTLTITKAILTVTADNKTKVYGAALPTLTATITGFVNSEASSVVSGAANLTTTATSGSAVNSYPITAALGTLAATNYTFTFVNGSLTITAATLTVTADNKTKIYGSANPTLTASFSGFVNGDNSSVITGAPSLSTTATAGSAVATYPITVAAGTLTASNYAFTFVNGSLTVTKATLTVTADNKAKVYGAALPLLTATITGFVNGDTSSVITGAPGLTTIATSGSAVSSYPISATIGTLNGANYTFSFVNGTLAVTPASLVITADNKAKVFGAPLPNFTATFAGLVNGDTPAALGGALNFNTTATASSAVGNYAIIPGGVSSPNYTISFANGTLAVTKADTSTGVQSSAATIDPGQSVTFTATVNVVAPGAGLPTGTVTLTDGSTVIGSGTLNAARQVTVTTSTLPSGTRSITATFAGDGSFNGSASPVFSQVVNNTLVGPNVAVQTSTGSSTVTTTFTNVTVKGNTTVTPIPPTATPPLPTGFTVAGNGTLAFEVQTTATFSGPITICFSVPSVSNPTDFANLKVLHGEGGVLVDRTSSHDFASRTVCAQVSSLSPFVIALNNATPVGPGDPAQPGAAASDTKAGSVLVFNFYSSSLTNPARENTRLNLTNTSADSSAYIHLFFVDGSTCSVADSYICLTPNQTTALLAADLDPGVSGYVIAVAVDKQTGCPINFNYLIGDEFIKLTSGHVANLNAVAFAALSAPVCSANSTTATLNFDNVSYNAVPRVLAVDSISSLLDNNSKLLVINRISGSLLSDADPIGAMFGMLFDDQENPYSFSLTAGCQLRQALSNTFPRTTPRLNVIIPNGRSAWMKLQASADEGLLGAALTFNPNAASSQNAFNQGHNLHALTLTTKASLIIPVHPPSCP